jgi:hypothetical protein
LDIEHSPLVCEQTTYVPVLCCRNPEHLAATGDAARFASALGRSRGRGDEGRVDQGGGLGLAAKLDVTLPQLAQAEDEALAVQARARSVPIRGQSRATLTSPSAKGA